MENESSKKIIEVVAGLFWQDKKFLICQRGKEKARGLLWEFVGGKVEPHETKSEALVRECKEELDIAIEVKDSFCDTYYNYPDISIHLTLFNAEIVDGAMILKEHNAVQWISIEEIGQYKFCPADKTILQAIANKNSNL